MTIRVLSCLLVIAVLLPVSASQQKYTRNDCITPTDMNYSWHGKVAEVRAFSKIEGLGAAKHYVLAFPHSGSRSAIFSKEIESKTKKIAEEHCVEL